WLPPLARHDRPGCVGAVSGAGQTADLLPADCPGGPIFPGSAARWRSSDRLPRLQLARGQKSKESRHSGLLLWTAADVGLGALAGEQGAEVCRSRAVAIAVVVDM